MSNRNQIQLQMNFRKEPEENTFRNRLNSAQFSLLFEIPVPSADSDLNSSVSRFAPIAEFAESCTELPCSLAFTDEDPEYRSYPMIEFASALVPDRRGAHVLYLSGRGRDEEAVSGFFAQSRLEGFQNVVCVSGMPSRNQPVRVFESVKMLQQNQRQPSPLFTGAVVNPCKYEICASLAQSFKMIKKVHAGASFGVVQFGWDAAKLQEISWRLQQNNCLIPLLARLMILTPQKAVDLCSGNYPGIRISKNFQNAVRSEMQHSTAQFLAAQWRRIQLHAAGAKFLGYSGLQIGGITSVAAAQTVYQMILTALAEFSTFQDWLDAVKDYYSQMEVVPYPWRYYLFDNLLQKDIQLEQANYSRQAVPEFSGKERFRYQVSKFLFAKSDRHPASERRISKKLLVSCKGCSQCRLPQSQFLCPEACPIGFCNGPCGEVDVSGKCFLTDSECVHAKRIRLAAALRDYEFLERTVI